MSRIKLAHKLYRASRWMKDDTQISELLADASETILDLVQETVQLKNQLDELAGA